MSDKMKTAVAAVAFAVSGQALAEPAPMRDANSFPIVELRQYTLHEGRRGALVQLFESHFIEGHEAAGMKVIGTFIDLDRPDRFVWLRGFRDMESRAAGLNAFYGGPLWKQHREAANATMIDSDNVLLLRAPSASAELRPERPGGIFAAVIYPLDSSPNEALALFEAEVKPRLEEAGVRPIGWFVPESAANNFPRLPVREGERVLAWFARFDSEEDLAAHEQEIAGATAAMKPLLDGRPELLRLRPTDRSPLGGQAGADRSLIDSGMHDFDFLHGRWTVRHRRLKARGAGSGEWLESTGSADTKPLLGGLCNVEEHRIDGQDFSGIAIRCFDLAAKRWSIWWVSARDGILQPPVHGEFRQGVGRFEGEDMDGDRPITARFLWHRITPASARWEQSFSYDGGKSWETNWTMDFQRRGD